MSKRAKFNIAFDNAIMDLNAKRQRTVNELNTAFEKGKRKIEREQYKRKKHLDEIQGVFNELKNAAKRLNNIDSEQMYMITAKNKQRLTVLLDKPHDFSVEFTQFVNNIKIKEFGSLKIQNKVIKHESICKENAGKSSLDKVSLDTLNDINEVLNHPKFEYDEITRSKTNRNKKHRRDNLKESLHNSTSPRMSRSTKPQDMQINYKTSNKTTQNVTYNQKDSSCDDTDRIKDIVYQKDRSVKNL